MGALRRGRLVRAGATAAALAALATAGFTAGTASAATATKAEKAQLTALAAPADTPPARTLKEGMKGADVKALQQRLAALKYYPGAADGNFGAEHARGGLGVPGGATACRRTASWARRPSARSSAPAPGSRVTARQNGRGSRST